VGLMWGLVGLCREIGGPAGVAGAPLLTDFGDAMAFWSNISIISNISNISIVSNISNIGNISNMSN